MGRRACDAAKMQGVPKALATARRPKGLRAPRGPRPGGGENASDVPMDYLQLTPTGPRA